MEAKSLNLVKTNKGRLLDNEQKAVCDIGHYPYSLQFVLGPIYSYAVTTVAYNPDNYPLLPEGEVGILAYPTRFKMMAENLGISVDSMMNSKSKAELWKQYNELYMTAVPEEENNPALKVPSKEDYDAVVKKAVDERLAFYGIPLGAEGEYHVKDMDLKSGGSTLELWSAPPQGWVVDHITRAKWWMDRFYQGNWNDEAFLGEYQGLALNQRTWRNDNEYRDHYLGWWGDDGPLPWNRKGYSKFHWKNVWYDGEQFDIGFEDLDRAWDNPDYDCNEPYTGCDTYFYDDGNGRTHFEITLAYNDGGRNVDIFWNQQFLRRLAPWESPWVTYYFDFYNHDSPSSNRYTLRHGSQMGQLHYDIWNDQNNGGYLGTELDNHGFTVDAYDPQFQNYADEDIYFVFSTRVYRDVEVWGQVRRSMIQPHSYPYWSKVGDIGVYPWTVISRADELYRTQCAIHVLNKYHNPDYEYIDPMYGYWPDYPLIWITPRSEARYLEGRYDQCGWGIPKPTGDTSYASGVRTTAFLSLETLIGYVYGDGTSQQYADSTAYILTQVQICNNDYQDAQGWWKRPNLLGGVWVSWKYGSWYADIETSWFDWLNMPIEHDGKIPANMETTESSAQAMRTYLRYKYGQSYPSGEWLPP